MNIFGIGLPEMAVIAAIGLLVFGPKRLPELGKTLGKTLKGFQSASSQFEQEFRKAVDTVSNDTVSVDPVSVGTMSVASMPAEAQAVGAQPAESATAEPLAANTVSVAAASEAIASPAGSGGSEAGAV